MGKSSAKTKWVWRVMYFSSLKPRVRSTRNEAECGCGTSALFFGHSVLAGDTPAPPIKRWGNCIWRAKHYVASHPILHRSAIPAMRNVLIAVVYVVYTHDSY